MLIVTDRAHKGSKSDLTDEELSKALSAPAGPALDAAVLAAIDSIFIPAQNRQNVKKGSSYDNTKLRGMALGAINTRHGIKASQVTWSRHNIMRLLAHWLKQALPDFTFTSIQVHDMLNDHTMDRYYSHHTVGSIRNSFSLLLLTP